ncbi:hypothetical protein [Pedobacter cryoconitis]|uniref:hypothetical protein n=1 Tax=Pedobacter cryoconitis TaxID=188932 RepID=UPI0011B9396B|nr:hypothetical protein [Pedobacter cryoconitis]
MEWIEQRHKGKGQYCISTLIFNGSPVFSKETNEVIGILVSGMMDFDWTGSCNTVSTCRYPYCFGEAVLRSDLICSVFLFVSSTPDQNCFLKAGCENVL